MLNEQQAMERQAMIEEIKKLRSQLVAMESDFAECAKGKSECFFCAKDDTCECVDSKECAFVWAKHN